MTSYSDSGFLNNGGRDPYDDAEEFAAVNAEAEAADATYAKLETMDLAARLRASLKRQGIDPDSALSEDDIKW